MPSASVGRWRRRHVSVRGIPEEWSARCRRGGRQSRRERAGGIGIHGLLGIVPPAPHQHQASRQHVSMDADVQQREGISPLTALVRCVDGESERRGLRRGLVPRRHREHVGGVGVQERGVVIVVGDAQVVLDDGARRERAGRDRRRVVLVVADRGGEDHGHRLPGRVGRPLEPHRAADLQLVALVPATLVLVAAEDGDRRHRIRGKDGISHAGVTKRFRVAGKVPRIAERHVESLP